MSWLGEPPLLLFRGIGPWEIAIVLIVLMLIFGATRLPKLGASLGQSLRAFKTSVAGQDEDDAGPTKDGNVKSAAKDEEEHS